jgi:hypothetical protein
MQTAHHVGTNVIAFVPYRNAVNGDPLSPAAMAQHLRETAPRTARRFARAMHDRVAWANESWGEFWADVERLI